MTKFLELAESLLLESGAAELLIELDQKTVTKIALEEGESWPEMTLTSYRFKTAHGWVTVQARGYRRIGRSW